MKKHIFRSLVLIFLVCTLMLSMTGCDTLDYRRAIELYNAGKFEAAGELFYELGDYEDSPALYKNCQYWTAASLAEAGKYSQALPRFIKLGNYENSAQWVTECNYQLAVAAFNEERWEDACHYFAQTPDYKNTQEYLRRMNWVAMYDAIVNVGFNAISTTDITAQIGGKEFRLTADTYAYELEFSVYEWESEDFHFDDSLQITLTRDSTVASYAAGSGFAMDYLDSRIWSSQSASGKIDITTCTPETTLVIETFQKHVEDHQGNITDSTDPAGSLMNNAMAENLYDLLTVIPELLLDAGITITLLDIGFYAL